MNKEIRNQRLGDSIANGIESNSIGDMLFIYDDDGFVTDTDNMAWEYNDSEDVWTNEEGETMQEAWANGIYVLITQNKLTQRVKYKFKGDIKIYGSEFGTSGIHEISQVSFKTEKPDTPDVDTIEEVNNLEQG
mgnify:FL=1|tara:strand:- start:205 stop:603 length:399 start_codon:yes stop_codon:yes gene_type:complete